MELLPGKLASKLPAIGSSPDVPLDETPVHIRFFDRSSNWRWYVLEYDGQDTFFGLLITNYLVTAGQFTLTELQSIAGEAGEPSIQRDREFSVQSVRQLAETEPRVIELLETPGPMDSQTSTLVQIDGAKQDRS